MLFYYIMHICSKMKRFFFIYNVFKSVERQVKLSIVERNADKQDGLYGAHLKTNMNVSKAVTVD